MALREECQIHECSNPVHQRGWCNRHYLRWYRHGDPLAGAPSRNRHLTDDERFWMKVDASGDCWVWIAGRNEGGYGIYRSKIASRWIWERMVAPIPAGQTIDHLCFNRACVNPDHLRVISRSENAARRRYPQRSNSEKTHCPLGHPYSNENTYHPPGDPTHRMCRACSRIRAREQALKRKAARRAR